MNGKTGKCPACKSTIKIEIPAHSANSATVTAGAHSATQKPSTPPPVRPQTKGIATVATQQVLDAVPSHRAEIGRDKDRFAAAVSVEPDKFEIVEPYLMDYESARAIAVQRQFPFTLFSDIALLTSHRLMVFRRFFTKVSMDDVNYVDFEDVRIQQGYFTSSITIKCINGRIFGIDKLITDQALNLYRHCQDIETKARIARRQFELEENRSRTNQLQINNLAPQPNYGHPGLAINSPIIGHRDISNIGDEMRDPFKLGE